MLRVAVLELPARWGAPEEALAEIDALLSRGPADLALVPELALTGYVSPRGDFDPSPFAEPIDGPTTAAAREIAARHACSLVVPLVLREGRHLYNASVLIDAGGVRATYRKRHPWIPERWATPGREPYPIVLVGGLRVALAICYDAQFLHRDGEALATADLLAFTSAWVDTEDSRLPLLRGLARRYGVAIANANWADGVVRVPGQGGSCLLDARGELLAVAEPGGRADATIAPRGVAVRLEG